MRLLKDGYLPCCNACSFDDPPLSIGDMVDSLAVTLEPFDDGCIKSIPLPLPPIGPPLREPRGLPRLLAPRTDCRIRALAPTPKAKWCPSRATLVEDSPNWWKLLRECPWGWSPPETVTGPSTSTTSPSLLVSSYKKDHMWRY